MRWSMCHSFFLRISQVFTKHATTFNATKKEQLARDLNEDLPFAPTLFPSMDEASNCF